jgi:hypothetical protein
LGAVLKRFAQSLLQYQILHRCNCGVRSRLKLPRCRAARCRAARCRAADHRALHRALCCQLGEQARRVEFVDEARRFGE